MIRLKIGSEERTNGDIKERWIAQQLQKRNGQAVCITLIIRKGDVSAHLPADLPNPGSGQSLVEGKDDLGFGKFGFFHGKYDLL